MYKKNRGCQNWAASLKLNSISNYLRTFDTIHSNRIEPTVAEINCQIKPSPPRPTRPNTNPPKKPPKIPMIRFHNNPLLAPLKILLPKNPAHAPITNDQINPIYQFFS